MIIQINQFGDKYQVFYENHLVGEFEILKKDMGILYKHQNDSSWVSSKVAQAIYSIFNKGVHVQHSVKYLEDFVVNQFDRKDTAFTLLHTYKNNARESTVFRQGKRIGIVFKNRKNIVFEPINFDYEPRAIGCFDVDAAQAANEMAKTYKQNIKFKVNGTSYIVTPETTFIQTMSMYNGSASNCYYKKELVGTYKYKNDYIELTPKPGVPMSHAFYGGLSLAVKTKRHVKFLNENDFRHLLFKLYKRELNRKNRG